MKKQSREGDRELQREGTWEEMGLKERDTSAHAILQRGNKCTHSFFSLSHVPAVLPMAKYNQKPWGKRAFQYRSTSWGTSAEQGRKEERESGGEMGAIQPNRFPSQSGFWKYLQWPVRPYMIPPHRLFCSPTSLLIEPLHSPGTLLP